LKIACSSLSPKFAERFAEVLLEDEAKLDAEFLAFASERLLCLPNTDVWFSLWFRPERFSRLALHALTQQNDAVTNAVATFSMFTLGHCNEVLTILAESFTKLTPEAKHNFLVSSIKSNYSQKERLLLSLSYDESLDKLLVEAVVAGLCACATPSAIARVIELADKKEMDEKLASVGAGIVHGSSVETAKLLSQYSWSSPVIKILIDNMQPSEDNNRIESDEE